MMLQKYCTNVVCRTEQLGNMVGMQMELLRGRTFVYSSAVLALVRLNKSS